MASKAKGIIVEIGGDTTSLEKALSKVNSASSSLSKELRGVNSLLKLDPKNTELVSQKQQVLKENIEKVTNKLQTLNDVQEQVKKKWEKYKEVESQLSNLKNKIEETSNTLKGLQEKQEKATEAFKNGKISKEQYDNINKSVEDCKNTLSELKKEQKELSKDTVSTEAYRDYQREVSNTKIKLDDLKKAYNNFMLEQDGWNISGKKIEEFGKKAEKVGEKLDKIGNKLSKTLTTSILGIGLASGKSAMDFETAFTGVEKTVDGTAEQMANLKQGIKDMSKELPSSATEIAAVAEAAGQLGIQTDNVLSFSKTMIDMGNSTNLTADEAATSLARFANITKMSQQDFSKLGSSIVDLGNNFATTESEIVDMALRLAGAGHQVGMSEGQILGLATALSSVGIEAEMGGSALSKAMVKMQNAVEQSGNKLENVIKKSGMSLRELELLAANDSMGFKEMAQSLGMTSTEIKQLITAGTNLEDFASISGMSAEEFKKAWKDDATGALTSFIKGLGNAESKGESAITMLSEMGLTEVRLRDSLLRAANAGELFNDAINTGTKAWEENNALTNEANKRYETFASKLKTTINKLQGLGVKLGDKLLPIVTEWLDKTDKWIDKLENIDDATLDNIIRIGLFVAAVGPAIKIIGKLTSTTGKGIEKVGQFAKKIGELDAKAKTTSSTFTKVTSSVGSFAGKTGFVVAGITGILGALNLLDKKINENVQKNINNSTKFINSMQQENEARKNTINTINDSLSANLSEIDNVQNLRNELDKLVDENGKVKDGYEARAKFILGELNKSLGTEYEMTGNLIAKYGELKGTIDEVIAKKKAQLILEANEENYKEAIKNKNKLYEDYTKTQDQLAKKLQEIKEINEKIYVFEGNRILDRNKAIKQYNELTDTLKEQEDQIKTYNKNITDYEKNSELMIKGGLENYKKIENSISEINRTSVNEQSNNIAQKLANEQEYLAQSKKNYDIDVQNGIEANKSKYKNNVETSQKNIEQLTNELIAMTSTTQTLEPEVVKAWTNLAQNSREEYNKAISKLPLEMQNKINEITGVVNTDVSVAEAVKRLGEIAVEKVNEKKNAFKEAGKNWLKGINEGINDKLTRQEALSSMNGFGVEGLQEIQKAWDIHSPSKKSEKLAINLLKGVPIGLKKEAPRTLQSMEDVAQKLLDRFNFADTNNISNIPKLQSDLTQQINTSITPKVITPSITINTQQLTASEMDRIIDTINRRYGSMY